MHLVYSNNSSLHPYTKEAPELVKYYNDMRQAPFPEIKTVRVPVLTATQFKYPTDPMAIWWLSIKSGHILGDVKKRGVVSCGYYRYDMPSSEVLMIDTATDLINICRRYHYEAVLTTTVDQTLFSILVKNGISVYTPSSGLVQPQNGAVGVWGYGKQKHFSWDLMKQNPPQIIGDSPVLPPPILTQGRNIPFFNYVYIPDKPDSRLAYIPSVRAASGYCIATNTKVDGVDIGALMKRFCRAQIFRNMFPYTRLTFVNQDDMRSWFPATWMFPKKKERGIKDVFAGAVEEVLECKGDDDTIVYGQIVAVFAPPTPAQKGEDELLHCLNLYNDEALRFFLQKIMKGEADFGDDRMERVYANVSVNKIMEIIQQEIRVRDAQRKTIVSPVPPVPGNDFPVTSGLNFGALTVSSPSSVPERVSNYNPFAQSEVVTNIPSEPEKVKSPPEKRDEAEKGS